MTGTKLHPWNYPLHNSTELELSSRNHFDDAHARYKLNTNILALKHNIYGTTPGIELSSHKANCQCSAYE